jgi:hypothetical protein
MKRTALEKDRAAEATSEEESDARGSVTTMVADLVEPVEAPTAAKVDKKK